jgi:biopolymer transport protein ExbD
MTAAGLAVAIPAVLAYNVFGKLVGSCEADLEGFAPRPARDDHGQLGIGAETERTWPSDASNAPPARADERHQHDAADRRDAGAAGDLHDHRAADGLQPQARPAAHRRRTTERRSQFISVALDAQGKLYFGEDVVDAAAFATRVADAARKNPRTEVQLRADQGVPYGRVAEVIGVVQKAGLSRIGFVTEPAATVKP